MVTPKDANNVPKPGKRYVCPPTSRFMGKYPYDAYVLLQLSVVRQLKILNIIYLMLTIIRDHYIEKMIYNDTKCNSGFSSPGDDYSSTTANNSSKRWNGASTSDPATAAKIAKGQLTGRGKVL